MKGVQWFIRGVDEEIDPFCVSDQNFGFNLSKHITLNCSAWFKPNFGYFWILNHYGELGWLVGSTDVLAVVKKTCTLGWGRFL